MYPCWSRHTLWHIFQIPMCISLFVPHLDLPAFYLWLNHCSPWRSVEGDFGVVRARFGRICGVERLENLFFWFMKIYKNWSRLLVIGVELWFCKMPNFCRFKNLSHWFYTFEPCWLALSIARRIVERNPWKTLCPDSTSQHIHAFGPWKFEKSSLN